MSSGKAIIFLVIIAKIPGCYAPLYKRYPYPLYLVYRNHFCGKQYQKGQKIKVARGIDIVKAAEYHS